MENAIPEGTRRSRLGENNGNRRPGCYCPTNMTEPEVAGTELKTNESESNRLGRRRRKTVDVFVLVLLTTLVGGVYFARGFETQVVTLRSTDGSIRWISNDAQLGETRAGATRVLAKQNLVLAWGAGKVTGLDQTTGSQRWSITLPNGQRVSVGTHKLVAYTTTESTIEAALYELTTGSKLWQKSIPSVLPAPDITLTDSSTGPDALIVGELQAGVPPSYTGKANVVVLDDVGNTTRSIPFSADVRFTKAHRVGSFLWNPSGEVISLDEGRSIPFDDVTGVIATTTHQFVVYNDIEFVAIDPAKERIAWRVPRGLRTVNESQFSRKLYVRRTVADDLRVVQCGEPGTCEIMTINEQGEVSEPVSVPGIEFDFVEDDGRLVMSGVGGSVHVVNTNDPDERWSKKFTNQTDTSIGDDIVAITVRERRWRFWTKRLSMVAA
jgi:hypothetical protein